MKSEVEIKAQLNKLIMAKIDHDNNSPGWFSHRTAKIKHAHISALFNNDIKTLQWVLNEEGYDTPTCLSNTQKVRIE